MTISEVWEKSYLSGGWVTRVERRGNESIESDDGSVSGKDAEGGCLWYTIPGLNRSIEEDTSSKADRGSIGRSEITWD